MIPSISEYPLEIVLNDQSNKNFVLKSLLFSRKIDL